MISLMYAGIVEVSNILDPTYDNGWYAYVNKERMIGPYPSALAAFIAKDNYIAHICGYRVDSDSFLEAI
jgi:hypothetical protein